MGKYPDPPHPRMFSFRLVPHPPPPVRQMRRQTSAHTQTCKRLVKEWAFYVSKSKCLSKVFVSIKGVYFQAEVCMYTFIKYDITIYSVYKYIYLYSLPLKPEN